jgi:Ni/Fe-hydrogenase subunit HybB-like protein
VLEKVNKPQWLALVHKVMVPVTIIGVTLSTLHQSTLGTLYLNMPYRLNTLWYTPILPLLFFISSIMAGLAVGILVYKLAVSVKRQPVNTEIVAGLGKILVGVSILYLTVKLVELAVSGDIARLLAFDQPSLLMLTELGLGVVLPAALLAMVGMRRQPWVQWVAPLLVLLGIMLNRFDATMFGQILPANTHYSPHILEWLSTLGIVAGASLVWVLAVRFLAICDLPRHHH